MIVYICLSLKSFIIKRSRYILTKRNLKLDKGRKKCCQKNQPEHDSHASGVGAVQAITFSL